MLAAVVGGGIVAGYGLALWWLLRREAAWAFAPLRDAGADAARGDP